MTITNTLTIHNASTTTHPIMTSQQAPAPVSSQLQGEDNAQELESSPQNKTDLATSDEAPEFGTSNFFEHTPWLVCPEEMSTGTKTDEAGKSYMFLTNAPVENYMAMDINDGYENAAGGDREFLAEYVQVQLKASKRYHIVVIPEANIEKADIPRWQAAPDWLDHNEFKKKLNKDQGLSAQAMVVKVESSQRGESSSQPQQDFDHQARPLSIDPPLTSFLPRKVFAEPQEHISPPHRKEDVKPRQDTSQRNSPQLRPGEHIRGPIELPLFSNRELELFQNFLQFTRARRRQQLPAAEQQPRFSIPEFGLFQDFIRFLRHRARPQQGDVDAIGGRFGQHNANSGPYNTFAGIHVSQYDANPDTGNNTQSSPFGNPHDQMNMTPQTLPQLQPQLYTPQMGFATANVPPSQGQYSRAGMPYSSPLSSGSQLHPLHHHDGPQYTHGFNLNQPSVAANADHIPRQEGSSSSPNEVSTATVVRESQKFCSYCKREGHEEIDCIKYGPVHMC